MSQDTEYGLAVSSAPSAVPSRRNCTPATATLSLADAVTVWVPETVAAAAGAVMALVGAALSTVTATGAEVVEFPVASRATAVNV